MTSTTANNLCPHCGEAGQPVPFETVSHLVKKPQRPQPADDYHLCGNPRCEVGYFRPGNEESIHKDNLKRPIWFKEGADPVYACYCKSITEQDVIRTVVETGLTDMKEIMLQLRGSLESTCRKTNPAGHCCTQAFNAMIQKGLAVREALTKTPNLVVDSVPVDKGVLNAKAGCTPTGCDQSSSTNSDSGCSCG